MINKVYKLYIKNYRIFYIAFLSILAGAMPHSRGLLSSAQIALLFSWILEADFNRKIKVLRNDNSIIIFTSIFLIHIIGLIYTDNFSYAFNDLKIKLPLLILPLIIGTSKKISLKEINIILTIFTISILVKTIYGVIILSGITGEKITDVQQIAGKFSHIRYALMLNVAVFSNVYFVFISLKPEKKLFIILRIITIFWLSIFIFVLHSVTGWVVFFVLIFFTFLFVSFTSKRTFLKKIGLIASLGVVILILSYLSVSVNNYYRTDTVNKKDIELKTKSGNEYSHNFNKKNRENGHFVNLYLCEKELNETWNKISRFKYSGKDKKNQKIKYTLIRYLTSKNLRKDKEGVLKLTKQDIENIENGYANYIYENKFALYPKIYEILWQIERYSKGGNPENHSVTQRFEFIKIAKRIIKNNFWIGVGTGDVKDKFQSEYKIASSKLSSNFRLRSHNQYVTFFVTFGVFGFLWFLFAFIYPGIKQKKFKDYLFLVIFIITALSMMNEDTLETQMGATTFAFFISLFLFGFKTKENK